MDELPDKIINIDILQINRSRTAFCKCRDRRYEVDTKNRVVRCTKCGIFVDPFEALVDIAQRKNEMRENTERLLEYKKELENWKPHLRAVHDLERIWKTRDMLPACPHCGKLVEAKDLARGSYSKDFYRDGIRIEQEKGEGDGAEI